MKMFERQQCEESLKCHAWHFAYFTQAGSPVSAAVYARAIARVEHFMLNGQLPKYRPKQVYQPTIRGHYASRKG